MSSTYKGVDEKVFYGGHQKIKELLEQIVKHKGERELGVTIKNVDNRYFKKLAEHLEKEGFPRKINSKTIHRSHDAYFLICPTCGNKTENVETNWILVRTEFDDNYRLVCSKCKGIKE